MISVLIPVFNVDVNELVKTLHQQLEEFNISGEIIVFDDASDEEIKAANSKIESLASVIYKELPKNYGRIEIRKKLAQQATFNYLLFIDCDSRIISKDYLKNYINYIQKDIDVITGGTSYQQQKPACNKTLHWKYGKEREVVTEDKKSFRTNNFCIKKSLFQHLKIPIQITGYGHEDTWIGIELKKLNASIAYINNPVLHLGLEDNKVFISKSLHALKNLNQLTALVNNNDLAKHVTLYKIYTWSKKYNLTSTIVFVYDLSKKSIYQNLTSPNPSLKLFDFYRLANFILLMNRED